jgi:hypothetical protein
VRHSFPLDAIDEAFATTLDHSAEGTLIRAAALTPTFSFKIDQKLFDKRTVPLKTLIADVAHLTLNG